MIFVVTGILVNGAGKGMLNFFSSSIPGLEKALFFSYSNLNITFYLINWLLQHESNRCLEWLLLLFLRSYLSLFNHVITLLRFLYVYSIYFVRLLRLNVNFINSKYPFLKISKENHSQLKRLMMTWISFRRLYIIKRKLYILELLLFFIANNINLYISAVEGLSFDLIIDLVERKWMFKRLPVRNNFL